MYLPRIILDHAITPPVARRAHSPFHCTSRAFTLIELMVSISILILIILGIGVTFSGASKSVGDSNAIMEMMSNVRSIQGLIEHDVTSVDKNCFLVIRSRVDPSGIPYSATTVPFARYFDQVSFVANGAFPNRTGADSVTPFEDTTVANTALVWWGQLVFENTTPPDLSYLAAPSAKVLLNQLPTGIYNPGAGYVVKENEFALGRHTMLLFPGPNDAMANVYPAGTPLAAYASPDYLTGSITGGDGYVADVTSSRYSVAAMTSSQLMSGIAAARAGGEPFPESDRFCYRYKALASVYDTEFTASPYAFVNGCFRMHPIAMKGVSSFKIEWTDGRTYQPGDADSPPVALFGQFRWYGASNPYGATIYNQGRPLVAGTEQYLASFAPLANGDTYIATFTYLNRASWPKALRISMHAVDPANRLKGGRDFVQIIQLPD